MNNLLENLNKEQLAAVMHHRKGPLLIVAGAGTGKTTAITQRIAYLIEQDKAGANEILALTFTEKAAGEMEERVDRLLPFGYLDLWISTFHGFGERILKDHGIDIGLPSDAKLLNEFEQWALIKKNLDKFELDYYRPLGNPTKFIHALVRHFSRAKDENISPAEYLKYAEELRENMDSMLGGGNKSKRRKAGSKNVLNFQFDNREMAEQEIGRINEVANAYHIYQQLLLDNNAMDFGDLINYTLKLFRERPAILARYRRQFKYILVDEFQDTNWAQYELVKMLAAPKNNLVVVGDDDQSIYAFRGASMSNILHFKKDYPKAREIVLVKNYRNRQNILNLAYDFIQLNNPNRLEWQLGNDKLRKKNIAANKPKLSKKLVAENKGKGVIEVIRGEDLQDEIRQIVEKIAELKISDKESNWSDFAVLVRANESAKEICSLLDAAGLPYQFLASRGLYTKPVIMDIVAYLKMLDDYHESPALYRILNLPVFGFSYQELVNFNYAARKKTRSLYTVLREARGMFGTEVQTKIDRVLGLIARHTALVRERGAAEIVLAFLEDSEYLKYLTGQPEAKAREAAAYLNQFMKRLRVFEASSDDRSVKAFLAELNMEMDAGEEGALSPDMEAGPEVIKVMTVHAAKGLEFKYVFLANMVDKRFPTIERREPIEVPDALVREILPEGEVHLEEERRLFYVAATRAKQGFYASWAPDYGGVRKKKPSRFLSEAGLVDGMSRRGARRRSNPGLSQVAAGLTRPAKAGLATTGAAKLPPYFSYTQLTAFENCPYQYKFAHILKVPVRGKFTFSFGQTMHLTLQKLFQLVNEKKGSGQQNLFDGRQDEGESTAAVTFEEILEIYEQKWIDDWYDNKKQKSEYRKLGRKILRDFYEKYKDNWPKTIYLEQGVNLKIGGNRIYGKIDRVDDLGGGRVRIVDYKTGAPKKAEKIGPKEKEQLLLYQMAAAQTLPGMEVSELQFYYLNDNSEVNFLGNSKELAGMEEKLIKRMNEIKRAVEQNEFPPKSGVLCKYCDFFHICEFRKGG